MSESEAVNESPTQAASSSSYPLSCACSNKGVLRRVSRTTAQHDYVPGDDGDPAPGRQDHQAIRPSNHGDHTRG